MGLTSSLGLGLGTGLASSTSWFLSCLIFASSRGPLETATSLSAAFEAYRVKDEGRPGGKGEGEREGGCKEGRKQDEEESKEG